MLLRGLMASGPGGGDPYWSSVSSLLHFNGTDGSTSFPDAAGKVWTPNGNVQIDTANSKFGGASALFDGAGDYLQAVSDASFQITGDFTIEAWVNPDVNNTIRVIASKRESGINLNEWMFYIDATGKVVFVVWEPGGTGVAATGTTTVTTGGWHHVAGVRWGTTVMSFLDGKREGVQSGSTSPLASTFPVRIGRDPTNTSRDFDGWVDELRITKGVARYTDDFPVPSAPFPGA